MWRSSLVNHSREQYGAPSRLRRYPEGAWLSNILFDIQGSNHVILFKKTFIVILGLFNKKAA